MATEALQTQLERVQAAIAAIEERGQATSIGTSGATRTLTRGDLGTLYKRERDLKRRIGRETNGGRRTFVASPNY